MTSSISAFGAGREGPRAGLWRMSNHHLLRPRVKKHLATQLSLGGYGGRLCHVCCISRVSARWTPGGCQAPRGTSNARGASGRTVHACVRAGVPACMRMSGRTLLHACMRADASSSMHARLARQHRQSTGIGGPLSITCCMAHLGDKCPHSNSWVPFH